MLVLVKQADFTFENIALLDKVDSCLITVGQKLHCYGCSHLVRGTTRARPKEKENSNREYSAKCVVRHKAY